jgi:hypothetical protein
VNKKRILITAALVCLAVLSLTGLIHAQTPTPVQPTQKSVLDRVELNKTMNMQIENCSEPSETKFEDIIQKAKGFARGPAASAKEINAELVYLTNENGGAFTDEVLSKVPTVKNGKGISKTKVWIVTFSGMQYDLGHSGPAGVTKPVEPEKYLTTLNMVFDAKTGLFLTGFGSK